MVHESWQPKAFKMIEGLGCLGCLGCLRAISSKDPHEAYQRISPAKKRSCNTAEKMMLEVWRL
jgi:hypothetical protein